MTKEDLMPGGPHTPARLPARRNRSPKIALAMLLTTAALSVPGFPAADESTFVVIVDAGNTVGSIKRQELARFFLKKTSRWTDGRGVIPVDQSANSPVRSAFTRSVLSVEGMGQTSAVQSFWLQ